MKTLARISALVLAMAVCCLGSRGPSMWLALITGAVALGILFAAAGRLGYLRSASGEEPTAEVVEIDDVRKLPVRDGSLARTAVRGR